MKNLFISSSLFLAVFLFVNCSSSDSSTPAEENQFQSNININFNGFQPSTTAQSLYTTLETGINDGQANKRVFFLKENSTINGVPNKTIEIKVTYPVSQSNINGTYNFSNSNLPSNAVATGQYFEGSEQYLFSVGAVTITDLGTNKYRIDFVNAKVSPPLGGFLMPITGYYSGTFF